MHKMQFFRLRDVKHVKIINDMNKIIYVVMAVLGLSSCANSFNIDGTSSISNLDGQKLYLKVFTDTTFKDLDSCDVLHGKFKFCGTIDSVRVANVFMNGVPTLPVVLEDGDITIKIDNLQQTVTGTPLNDELTEFIKEYQKLANASAELVHKHDQAIMDGKDMEPVIRQLQAEDEALNEKMDKLVTKFVEDNMDNILGPWVFLNTCTSKYEFPMLDAWIDDIMTKATDKFKNDPMVKEYYEKAQENQQIMNGMKEAPVQQPVAPVPNAPTPNELAKPAE
jgi:hypothetical protein